MLSTRTILFEITRLVCQKAIADLRGKIHSIHNQVIHHWATDVLPDSSKEAFDRLNHLEKLQGNLDLCTTPEQMDDWLAELPVWVAHSVAGSIREFALGVAAAVEHISHPVGLAGGLAPMVLPRARCVIDGSRVGPPDPHSES